MRQSRRYTTAFFLLMVSFCCSWAICALGQSASTSSTRPGNDEPAASATQSTAPAVTSPNMVDPSRAIESAKDSEVEKRPTEDWNTLKIPADLKVADPLPGLHGETADFKREFVQLTWRAGDVIDLYIFKPKKVEKPPVILYLYGFPTDTDRFKMDFYARTVTRNGFAAVGFVSALTGQRFHNRPTKEWFVSDLQEALGSSVHDVQLILNYLDKRGDLDMTRVGMYAEGSGASIAIMAASVDPRIGTLDLLDPWGDWPDWMANSTLIKADDERASYTKPEFLKKVENLDPVNYLPQLKTQRIRVQFIDTDTITPKAARERLEEAVPPNAKKILYKDPAAFAAGLGSPFRIYDWVQQHAVTPVDAKGNGTGNANSPQSTATERVSDR